MIKGMTGFGTAQATNKKVNISVEIKSVNHRYLDVNYYLPNGFNSIEAKLRQILQKQVYRGRVTVSVKIAQKEGQKISVNKDVAKTYLNQINRLKKDLKLKGDVAITDILKLQGVLEVKDTQVSPQKIFPDLEKAFRNALTSLVVMRKREGTSLSKDILKQLTGMSLQIRTIKARSKALLRAKKAELPDEDFASYQKSNDINEEVSRLLHYIDEMKKFLRGTNPVGKKIDFIGQEMQRETNTIGSKLQDKIVSGAVISLKGKVEKIREQAQNIE